MSEYSATSHHSQTDVEQDQLKIKEKISIATRVINDVDDDDVCMFTDICHSCW